MKKYLLSVYYILLSTICFAGIRPDISSRYDGVRIDTFGVDECPEDMTGCGDVVAQSFTNYDKDKFLFVSDWIQAFIKVNGVFIKLSVVTKDDDTDIIEYRGGDYCVRLIPTKDLGSGYETFSREVTFQLFKNGVKLGEMKNCYMMSGC